MYINIVEKTSGFPPSNVSDSNDQCNDEKAIKRIIEMYKNHSSILNIKENIKSSQFFELPKAQVNQINRLINSLDITKATGPDSIPPKLVKLSSNIIDSHLCNIINQDIENANFSDGAKVASVRPIFKKKERIEIENYRPVSVLNVFSKVYEKYILETLSSFIDNFLSQFISSYRKS